MKIDIEQFLAITVALGAAGAIGVAAYSGTADLDKVAIEAPASVEEPAEDPSTAEQVAAAVMPATAPAEPIDLDEASGIPPVVPDDESAAGYYAPGPDTESPNW